ncbi:FAD-binding oxidoreductase [Uliginosibacterium sp. H3]|uniref:FAD-binding oxidoreductase n=1 Tax=Uliginosibacterium silvisoli TaxID=3114758 RepID=A0ABU6K2C4_9RHOO|nr:FAD-binding oxidoreductase [Uliginosibacterium sp. H3]
MTTMPVSSWGRLAQPLHHIVALRDATAVPDLLRTGQGAGLAFGMGRSYGDVCLNDGGTLWKTTGLDRFVSFDEQSGLLVCEAGALVRDIQRLVIPRGWILPVTPGTQLITVGGAIANDVHGKNHHVLGSFGDHVKRIRLVRTDGSIIDCGPSEHAEWFAATVGGLGLTGVMTEVQIQLRRTSGPWLDTETIPYAGLDEFFTLADGSESGWEHTVSWIDCLDRSGRGVFMRGNPATRTDIPAPAKVGAGMPVVPPVSLVNGPSLRAFNTLYFNLKKHRAGRQQAHYEPFFYPLDNVPNWNRMYGPKGFFQYQSVVPRDVARDAVQAMLEVVSRSGSGSFLAVLKTFGDRESPGLLSFPRPGATLALDFPNKGEPTHKLFAQLDAIVMEAKGRLYPAKDARMPQAMFQAGYPGLEEFSKFRDAGISSALSRRLMGS